MTTSLVWPKAILSPGDYGVPYMPGPVSGSTSLSGFTQRVMALADHWRVRYSDIAVFRDEQVRKWRELEALLAGGTVPILVPLLESLALKTLAGVTTAASASKGATSLSLAVTTGTPVGGMHFNIGERLYMLKTVSPISGGNYPVTIVPRLREDVGNGATVDFQDLKLKARLMDPNGMSGAILEQLKHFTASVDFIEDVS